MGPIITEPTFLEAALAMDCIYGFKSIDRVKIKPSKQKLVSSGNSMPFISPGTMRVSMAIERKQFRFSGIECHKPSVTLFHNTMQV